MSDVLPCRFCGNRPFAFEDDDYVTIGCQGHDCSPRPCVEGLRASDVKASWNALMEPVSAELLEALEEVVALASESDGVAGYHLNGMVTTWDELNLKIFDAVKRAKSP